MLGTMDNPTCIDLGSAIEKAGGQSVIARQLGITQQSVAEWISRGVVPARRVLEVERLTGISRYELRPDIYPREAALAQ